MGISGKIKHSHSKMPFLLVSFPQTVFGFGDWEEININEFLAIRSSSLNITSHNDPRTNRVVQQAPVDRESLTVGKNTYDMKGGSIRKNFFTWKSVNARISREN